MADIAAIFHWPPGELWAMSLEELMDWRRRAVELHNQINAPPER
ncbi:P2 GpE family protein [Comamonas thiooxydans]|uniref:p2 GpE family protein n=1 Tax=Comamonas thiooxydans TaxID=363952 RepID=A0A0E3BUJ5_9BURK|nr:GpE family phage tail protein [Comamonas thiooxydans]KGH12140.1 P2 GpE family protein [Comamonas thiooxydans]KGH18363.1 P2 GpE family protein [Comamonas thiooxydans]